MGLAWKATVLGVICIAPYLYLFVLTKNNCWIIQHQSDKSRIGNNQPFCKVGLNGSRLWNLMWILKIKFCQESWMKVLTWWYRYFSFKICSINLPPRVRDHPQLHLVCARAHILRVGLNGSQPYVLRGSKVVETLRDEFWRHWSDVPGEHRVLRLA